MSRVLIVEDDPALRFALHRLLAQEGHDVSMAFTAEAAMRILSQETFDVVLLDILLTDDTGWSVAGYIQTDPRLRGTPILVVSGMEPEEIRAGAQAYANMLASAAIIISKPVDAEQLLQSIARVTRRAP